MQQSFFSLDTSCIPRERAIRTHHTMAGNDDRNRIVSDRSTHSLGRHRRKPAFCSDAPCNISIGQRVSKRNGEQLFPHLSSEVTVRAHHNGWCEARILALEIGVEPTSRLFKDGKFGAFLILGAKKGIGKVLLPIEPKSDKRSPLGSHRNVSKGTVIMCNIVHRTIILERNPNQSLHRCAASSQCSTGVRRA